LNGDIELKGDLRIVKFTEDAIETIEYPSDYMFKHTKKLPKNIDKITEELLVNVLRNNDNVNERQHGNISSFNFNKKVFFDRIWNDQTVKSRGLFINTKTNEIVARSYDKFFNLGERRDTELVNLKHTISFPIIAYEKENGFLGILGYDKESNEVLYCSKATLDNDYAGYFKTLVDPHIVKDGRIMKLLKSGHSLVFEVIDIENDPHIIEHKKSKVILLDIIKNIVNYSSCDYPQLKNTGDIMGVKTKIMKNIFQSWGEFTSFLDKVKNHKTEGFVFEDANGFMVKYKTNFYNQWKHSRMLVDKIKKGESINLKDCVNIEENLFINFIENTYRNNLDDLQDKSIIELRKEFKNQNN
jgi:tRNA splicing ligase